MKKLKAKSKNNRKAPSKSPRKPKPQNKFHLFTLAFIVGALVLTLFAVQQQQNLIQDAAKKDECPAETELSREDRQATRAAEKEARKNDEPDVSAEKEEREKKDKEAKPSCKPEKDKEKNKDKNSGGNGARRNNNGWDPNRLGCNLFPNLPYCNRNGGGDNSGGNPCPSGNTNGRNGGGSGRDGKENVSNEPGTVNIGEINDDETSNTTIIINGKEYTREEFEQISGTGGATNLGDINTGGKQGGSHSTVIEIDENGIDDYDNQSGSDGNGRNNNGSNPDDCPEDEEDNNGGNGSGAQANSDGGKKSNNGDKKDSNKSTGGTNNGSNGGLFCNIMPWLLWCR